MRLSVVLSAVLLFSACTVGDGLIYVSDKELEVSSDGGKVVVNTGWFSSWGLQYDGVSAGILKEENSYDGTWFHVGINDERSVIAITCEKNGTDEPRFLRIHISDADLQNYIFVSQASVRP